MKASGHLYALKLIVGGKLWHAPCKILSLHLFCMSVLFNGNHNTVPKKRYIWPHSVLGYYHIYNIGVSLCDGVIKNLI